MLQNLFQIHHAQGILFNLFPAVALLVVLSIYSGGPLRGGFPSIREAFLAKGVSPPSGKLSLPRGLVFTVVNGPLLFLTIFPREHSFILDSHPYR